ncbi:MAG: hypothetical protein A2W53_08660 [Nitrospinae bacterium RIFCSPHIGHO2_02_39_11]|nr:MAG: hypothetical protein A2W53_08660 [Nitrospinae bacterium RIFCSPHIGHO2_02_39_11]
MKFNIQMLTGRIDVIRTALSHLQEISKVSKEDFLKDYRYPASAETFLRHCLEAIFDIGRHILAKTDKVRLTHEYKDIARGLGKSGVISKALMNKLLEMAGYRNRIVHFYHEITDEEIYHILKNDLSDIKRFIEEIGKFMKKYADRENN